MFEPGSTTRAILLGAVTALLLEVLLSVAMFFLFFGVIKIPRPDTLMQIDSDMLIFGTLLFLGIILTVAAYLAGGYIAARLSTAHEARNALLAASVAAPISLSQSFSSDGFVLVILGASSVLMVCAGWLGGYIWIRTKNRASAV